MIRRLLDKLTKRRAPAAPAGALPLAYSAAEYIEGLATVRAKFSGPSRKLTDVDTIVIHRLWKADAARGVQYVATLYDKRRVSWHYTVDAVTGETWRHLPLSRVAWHCRYPAGMNRRSVGIEIGGPMGSPISRQAHDAVRKLVRAIKDLCPIEQVGSHEYYDSLGPRANRTDPGPEFDFDCLAGLGLEICTK